MSQSVEAPSVSGPRIAADVYHDKVTVGYGALAYEFGQSQSLVLGLAGLGITRLDMENKPNVVQVVTGKGIWVAPFNHTVPEVPLSPETRSSVRGDQPFPGFNEDGVITVGHLPPTKTGLSIFWATAFKIANRPNGHGPL